MHLNRRDKKFSNLGKTNKRGNKHYWERKGEEQGIKGKTRNKLEPMIKGTYKVECSTFSMHESYSMVRKSYLNWNEATLDKECGVEY